MNLVLGCVSSESLIISLPTDRMSHHPAFFVAYIYVTFSSLMPLHSNQQCLPGVGIMPLSVLPYGLSKIQSLGAIFQSYVREISNLCVTLEATHQINR